MSENILSLVLRMVAMLEINGGKVNLFVYSGTSRERNTVNSLQRKEIDMTGFTNVCDTGHRKEPVDLLSGGTNSGGTILLLLHGRRRGRRGSRRWVTK